MANIPTAQSYSPHMTPSGLTGWAAMERTVRDIDEEKIRYCKEDIDTLLVFAGLFSAVLTAFLIESSRNLQPPETSIVSETTMLLREIANNTRAYAVGTGSSNAALASTLTPVAASVAGDSYSAPLTAIRINVLWHASLVFSLATASFGMLVKQWLREYLACDYTSPQARLRIRQYRDPGVRAWKIFELAAILPLLLQVSLALFFVGLCFFTRSIEQTVARTTIALICVWAFLLCVSFMLPIFFPRCPYKTTAFLRIARFLRFQYFRLRAAASQILTAPDYDPSAPTLPQENTIGRTPWLHRIAQLCAAMLNPGKVLEEDEVARKEDNDMDMLISVDAALTDDNVLGTTIWEAVQQLRLAPGDTLAFLSQVIKHRIPFRRSWSPTGRTSYLLDLRALTSQGWQAATDVASSVISGGLDSSTITAWPVEVFDAFCFVLSYSSYPLPDRHVVLLRKCLEMPNWTDLFAILRHLSHGDPDISAQVLRRFRKPLVRCPLPIAIPQFAQLLEATIGDKLRIEHLWKFLRDHSHADPSFDSAWCEALEIVAELIGNVIGIDEIAATELPYVQSAVCALLFVPAPACSIEKFRDVFRYVCDDVGCARVMMQVIVSGPFAEGPWTTDNIIARMRVIYGTIIDDITRGSFIRGTIRVLHSYATHGQCKECGRLNVVTLCRILLDTHSNPLNDSVASHRPYDDESSLSSDWKRLWDAMTVALFVLAAGSANSYAYSPDALECLALLNTWYQHDTQPGVAEPPSADGEESTEPFPDALFAVLSLFVPERDTLSQFNNIQVQLSRSDMLFAGSERRLCKAFSGGTLWESLPQAGFKMYRLFPRLLQALHAHIPLLRLDNNAQDLPDLSMLSQRAWILSAGIAASVVMRGPSIDLDGATVVIGTTRQSVEQAFLLLLARSEYDIPTSGVRALAACFDRRSLGATQYILTTYPWSRDPSKLAYVLRRVRPSIFQLPGIDTATLAINAIVAYALHEPGERCHHKTITQCLWAIRNLDCDDFWHAIRDIYMDRAGDLVQLLKPKSDVPFDWNVFDWVNCYRIPRSVVPQFHETLRQLLLHPSNSYFPSCVYRPLVVLDSNYRKPSFTILTEAIRTIYTAADHRARCQLVHVFTSIPNNFNTGHTKLQAPFDYIRVLLLHLEIYKAHCPFDTGRKVSLPALDGRDAWDELWTTTAASLRKFAKAEEPNPAEERELALECFALLDSFESRIRGTTGINGSPDPDDSNDNGDGSPFPDELYATLAAFVPVDEATKLARFEHIQQRLPASHRQTTFPGVAQDPTESSASAVVASLRVDLAEEHSVPRALRTGDESPSKDENEKPDHADAAGEGSIGRDKMEGAMAMDEHTRGISSTMDSENGMY